MISLVNNRPSANNFSYSASLQDWTRATSVRLRLLRTKTLLGHLMAVARQDPTVTRRVSNNSNNNNNSSNNSNNARRHCRTAVKDYLLNLLTYLRSNVFVNAVCRCHVFTTDQNVLEFCGLLIVFWGTPPYLDKQEYSKITDPPLQSTYFSL